MAVRRVEDIQSCQVLGAAYRHFEIPDCIYRRSPISQQHLYDSEEALWIPPHSDEAGLVAQISSWMRAVEDKEVQWVCPLSLGGHVDHRLTRQAAQQAGVPLWFYADYPYVLSTQDDDWEAGMTGASFPVSGTGLLAWQQAVATHQSQISTFWNSLAEMRAALTSYCQRWDGVRLWRF